MLRTARNTPGSAYGRLGPVATARAVQRGDVLERHEDVPVQLDMGDVLDVAVRGQHALLVLPAEERDLDLLALVLVGVVLHRAASVYPREGTVPDGDADVAAVVQVGAPVTLLRVGDPRGVRQQGPDRAAVQNDQDLLAGMAPCDLLQRCDNPLAHRGIRL